MDWLKQVALNLQQLVNNITDIWNNVISFLWQLLGIVKTIFYWLTSLLGAVWDLFYSLVLEVDPFYQVNRAFVYLSNYIWWPATVFISTLLVVAILRIWIAFVFKILRLNIDYNTLQKKTTDANVEANKRKSAIFKP